MNITSLDFMPPVYGNSMEVLRELVRSVVREELQKQRLDQNAPMISSLADVIREEHLQEDAINQAAVAYNPFGPTGPTAGSSATCAEFNMAGVSSPDVQTREGSSHGATYGSRGRNADAVPTSTVAGAGCTTSGCEPNLD
ncbi:hypothetical protein HPB52_006741 [Rhipicephalus sanguineus]|uniref:Uncharacterized protein n=1 Tax=Rhipicephalus sanguineus TaxID=34632 RepID=A0A9D4PDE1_RHISA|nr:hypothetical protein HPB52_006741 [Rhipicephalus sanguineus]